MPLLETKGSASAQGFGEFAKTGTPTYIENVFSTWLVTPTSSNTTYSITNGIDVSGKGGMVWMKSRSSAANNLLYDTARGASAGSNNALISNSSSGQQTAYFDYITGLSNGFTVNFATGGGQLTNNGINYASWTFRKQPKFFDVVTYTGTGANRTIAHALGSAPGCIIVKRTDTTGDWQVYHNSLTSAAYSIQLDLTNAQASTPTVWNSTAPTSTVFSVGTNADVNASGGTYVAYLFAHNAGGFGLTGTDNVISCGSYTGNGSTTGPVVTLGYEPQWLLIKKTSASATNWVIADNMRGMPVGAGNPSLVLFPNTSDAEYTSNPLSISPLSTGFQLRGGDSNINASGDTYIYIAIRRGPMKVPTDGTKVFLPQSPNSSGSFPAVVTNFPVDMGIYRGNKTTTGNNFLSSRLQGPAYLYTNTTAAEAADTSFEYDSNVGYLALSGASSANFAFQRAPSFFDEVCYTGTGTSGTAIPHNLGVAPELIISKARSTTNNWLVWATALGNQTSGLLLNTTDAVQTIWASGSSPTSSNVYINYNVAGNSGVTYVSYLFATCAGVSKVTSFTGNGSTQTINCGFTSGARFVLIKATSTTGNWLTFDTARGMTTSTDPWLALNSTAAESATTGACTTTSVGFTVDESKLTGVNTNGVSYIALAIA